MCIQLGQPSLFSNVCVTTTDGSCIYWNQASLCFSLTIAGQHASACAPTIPDATPPAVAVATTTTPALTGLAELLHNFLQHIVVLCQLRGQVGARMSIGLYVALKE